jgi:uroporphyrinogen decarboxylase
MTGKQRFLCALNHQEPDYVPIFEILYSRQFFKHILGYAPETLDPVEVAKLASKVGYDITMVGMGGVAGYTVGNTGDVYTDEWGVTYKKDPISWPMDGPLAYPLNDGEDWKNYTMPDVTLESRYAPVREAVQIASETGLALIGNVRGPFSASWMLFGMANFCIMLYTEPEIVDEVMKANTDFAIYGARKMVELGVDCIQFADDYGTNLAPFISVEHFDRFVVPHIHRLTNAVHKAGGKIYMHSDGHIMPVLASCVAADIDGYNPIQRGAGMDLATVKRLYGDKLCLLGNVDQRHLMVHGTKEEVMEQAKECIRIAAPGGGFCLGSDHSIHDDIPVENVLAIYEAGRKYGKYPISL